MAEDNTKTPNSEAEENKSKTDIGAGVVGCDDDGDISTETKKTHGENEQQIKWQKISAIMSIALALIAGIGVVLVWVQINQTEDALSISGEALEITRETLDAARQDTRLEQRPWLGYHSFGIEVRDSSAGEWRAGKLEGRERV